MENYQKQALDFLKATNSTLVIRWLKYDYYFADDKEKRDIWECKLTKDRREYIFKFGSSIVDHEEMLNRVFPFKNPYYAQRAIDENKVFYIDYTLTKGMKKYRELIKKISEWGEPGKDTRPTAYSVLAGLETYEQDDLDDFAANFGYTKPSEALKVFNAVNKQVTGLKQLYSEGDLDLLREIN